MPASRSRKVYDVKGIAGSGGSFRVGTIVKNEYGAPGVIVRILPAYKGDEGLGPRGWVAYDVASHKRRLKPHRTPEGFAKEMSGTEGRCELRREYLYHLKPIGQAKHIPKCVVTTRPHYVGSRLVAHGRWVRASKPPRRKTPCAKWLDTEARLKELYRKARSSREGFPKYKPAGPHTAPHVAHEYERYAYGQRQSAKWLRESIVTYKAKGTLLHQWRAEIAAHERRAVRAERIAGRLRSPLIETAQKATRR